MKTKIFLVALFGVVLSAPVSLCFAGDGAAGDVEVCAPQDPEGQGADIPDPDGELPPPPPPTKPD